MPRRWWQPGEPWDVAAERARRLHEWRFSSGCRFVGRPSGETRTPRRPRVRPSCRRGRAGRRRAQSTGASGTRGRCACEAIRRAKTLQLVVEALVSSARGGGASRAGGSSAPCVVHPEWKRATECCGPPGSLEKHGADPGAVSRACPLEDARRPPPDTFSCPLDDTRRPRADMPQMPQARPPPTFVFSDHHGAALGFVQRRPADQLRSRERCRAWPPSNGLLSLSGASALGNSAWASAYGSRRAGR